MKEIQNFAVKIHNSVVPGRLNFKFSIPNNRTDATVVAFKDEAREIIESLSYNGSERSVIENELQIICDKYNGIV